jgi:hypothetical protein
VRYWIDGGGFGGARVGGVASEIATWVAQTFQQRTVGDTTVYDLSSPTVTP